VDLQQVRMAVVVVVAQVVLVQQEQVWEVLVAQGH
jgi:hypothetical protein